MFLKPKSVAPEGSLIVQGASFGQNEAFISSGKMERGAAIRVIERELYALARTL
jgi:hypothetical protein